MSPAEGHTIFAYVAIAVYDAVMAVEGGYEPFAVDVDAPDGASAEAAVAAAAHRILVHYLPAQAASIVDPAYAASLATIPDGQAETDGVATGEAVAGPSDRPAGRRRLPGAGDLHAAEPTDPGRLAPDGTDAADRSLPRADGPVQPRAPPTSSDRAGRHALDSRRWARDYNEVKEIGSSHEHDPDRRADAGRPVLGRSTRSSRPVARSASSCSTTSSTSSTRHGSWR